MIDTSAAYKKMMNGAWVRSRIEIDVTNGREIKHLRNRDIVRESLNGNWRASNNQAFSLGTCYSAALNFSSTQRIPTRVEGEFLTITPAVIYDNGNGTEERFDLGVFRCDTVTAYPKTTSYECYDLMLALDRPVTSRVGGTAYFLLDFIADKCEIILGNTAAEIGAMINSTELLYLDPRYLSTYRDALSQIAIILGGYAIFGRDGKLYIRHFHTTPDRELARKRRTSSSFATYKTYFYGIKCRFLADQNFYTYESNSQTREDGVVLDLGDISIVENDPFHKQQILDNIFSLIRDIEYTPASINMVGDPSIEPGDMIETKDRDGYTKTILLTSVTYNWRKECEILSEGSNPKLGKVTTAQKKTQKQVETSTANNTVVTATYKNADIITITGASAKEITSLKFATLKNLTAIFGAEVPVYASGDGYINITYNDNGVDGDTVTARVHPGYNLITLVNHLYYETGRIVNLKLNAEAEAIGTGTAPTITIDSDKIRSYIFAQGIEVETPWDGTIILTDAAAYIEAIMEAYGLTGACTLSTVNPDEHRLTEAAAAIQAGVQGIGLSDIIDLTIPYIDSINYAGENYRAGTEGVLL